MFLKLISYSSTKNEKKEGWTKYILKDCEYIKILNDVMNCNDNLTVLTTKFKTIDNRIIYIKYCLLTSYYNTLNAKYKNYINDYVCKIFNDEYY